MKSVNNKLSCIVDYWVDSILKGYIIEFSINSIKSYNGNKKIYPQRQRQKMLPPFTHLGHVAEIFKPLGASLGASLESRVSPCSWLLRLGSTPNEAKGGRPC